MKKQTAVEWLIEAIGYKQDCDRITIINLHPVCDVSDLVKRAKQMEKEQIQDAWHDGNFLGRNGNLFADYNTKEGYYKSEFENK